MDSAMAVCGPHHQRAPVVQEGGDSEREREREREGELLLVTLS